MDTSAHLQWNNQTCLLKKYKLERENYEGRSSSIVRVVHNSQVKLPTKFTEEPLLLYTIKSHKKVISQCVESYDSLTRDTVFAKQRFSIPLTYPGWFEVLNEDGKAVQPLTHIWELVEGDVDTFLIRAPCRAYTNKLNNEPNFEKTRTIAKDEVMTMIGKITAIVGWRKKKVQLLHCLDEHGRDVYFDYKTQGIFSAVAGPNNISGVHKMERIIANFRFPITVKVVAGKIPQTSTKGSLPGVFRLVDVQKDQMAFFLPLYSSNSASTRLVPISVRTPVELQSVTNMSNIYQRQDYKTLLRLCKERMEKYFETIQMLISTDTSYETFPPRRSTRKRKDVDQRAFSAPVQRTEEDVLFEEVDDLYDYVRRGGDPPKPRPRTWEPHGTGNSLTLAGKSSSAANLTHCKSQPDLRLSPLSPVEIDQSPSPSQSRPSPQPLLDSNGRKRGKLAALTNGRFNKAKDSAHLKHATSTPSVYTTTTDPEDSAYSTCSRRKRYYENIDLVHGEKTSSTTAKKQTHATLQPRHKPEILTLKPRNMVTRSLSKRGVEKEMVMVVPPKDRLHRPSVSSVDWGRTQDKNVFMMSKKPSPVQGIDEKMTISEEIDMPMNDGQARLSSHRPDITRGDNNKQSIPTYTNSNEARLKDRDTLVHAIRSQLIAKNLIVVDKPAKENFYSPTPPQRTQTKPQRYDVDQPVKTVRGKVIDQSDAKSASTDSDDKTLSSKSGSLSQSTNLSHSTSDLVKIFENMKNSPQSSTADDDQTTNSSKKSSYSNNELLSFKVMPQSYRSFHAPKGEQLSPPMDYNSFNQSPGREYTPKKLSATMQQRIVLFQGINA